MTQLEKIKREIQKLSPQDFVVLRKWFAELDWEKWDEELEADAAQGKLDFLIEEARAVKSADKVTTHHNLDFLAGTWSEEDVKEFEDATADFRKIDKEMWGDDSEDAV